MADRYYVSSTKGYPITGASSTSGAVCWVEYLVLDREWAHRVVGSFTGSTAASQRTVAMAERAAETCARRLNGTPWTMGERYRELRALKKAGVPTSMRAKAVGVTRYQAWDWLRKGGPPVVKVATHCRKGHRYTEANTRLDPAGHRRCRKCAAAVQRRRWARLQQARNAHQ